MSETFEEYCTNKAKVDSMEWLRGLSQKQLIDTFYNFSSKKEEKELTEFLIEKCEEMGATQ